MADKRWDGNETHYLYRHFDAAGKLLYVGVTRNVHGSEPMTALIIIGIVLVLSAVLVVAAVALIARVNSFGMPG